MLAATDITVARIAQQPGSSNVRWANCAAIGGASVDRSGLIYSAALILSAFRRGTFK